VLELPGKHFVDEDRTIQSGNTRSGKGHPPSDFGTCAWRPLARSIADDEVVSTCSVA